MHQVRNLKKKPAQTFKRILYRAYNRIIFPLFLTLAFVLAMPFFALIKHFPLLFILVAFSSLMFLLVRLFLYFIRSFFPPSTWMKDLERVIASLFVVFMLLSDYEAFVSIHQVLGKINFKLGNTTISLWQVLQGVLMSSFLYFVAFTLNKILEKILSHTKKIDLSAAVLISKIFRIFLFGITTLVILNEIGIEIQTLTVFSGALGVGIGLGLQRLASNYISGISILIDRSIKLGDVVSVDKQSGVVNRMTARYTVVRSQDGTEAIVPNETLVTSVVLNHSYSSPEMRLLLPLHVSYESSLDEVFHTLESIASKNSRVLAHPKPQVFIKEFGKKSISLQLSVWIQDPQLGQMDIRSDLNLEIWKAFKTKNLDLSFEHKE